METRTTGRLCLCLLASWVVLLPGDPATGAAGAGSLFQKLSRVPTGQNGFEELMLAADSLAVSPLLTRHEAIPAAIHLLGCHAAIRRYRWERQELPPELEPLRVGDLAIGTYLGKPLGYRVREKTYRLASTGYRIVADDPRAPASRHPITIVPDEDRRRAP